jgi:hypothetical protein
MLFPGLERSDYPGFTVISDQTLKGFGGWRTLSGLIRILILFPGLERSDNPGFTVISDQTLKGFGGEFLSKVVYAKHQAATL